MTVTVSNSYYKNSHTIIGSRSTRLTHKQMINMETYHRKLDLNIKKFYLLIEQTLHKLQPYKTVLLPIIKSKTVLRGTLFESLEEVKTKMADRH